MNSNRRIILASKSPRRQELLKLGGIEYEVIVSDEDEIINSHIPHEVVEDLSNQKAKAVFDKLPDRCNVVVIGADTIVSYDGEILGKPKNEKDAFRMLSDLSGNTHEVYTGVTVIWSDADGNKSSRTFSECTKVVFYELTSDEIEAYIASRDPMDKAGAYGIQSGAAKFVKGIDGDYNNVVGLPLARLYHELRDLKLI